MRLLARAGVGAISRTLLTRRRGTICSHAGTTPCAHAGVAPINGAWRARQASGNTLVESNNINKSLLTLGNCISALSDARKRNGHIPCVEKNDIIVRAAPLCTHEG